MRKSAQMQINPEHMLPLNPPCQAARERSTAAETALGLASWLALRRLIQSEDQRGGPRKRARALSPMPAALASADGQSITADSERGPWMERKESPRTLDLPGPACCHFGSSSPRRARPHARAIASACSDARDPPWRSGLSGVQGTAELA